MWGKNDGQASLKYIFTSIIPEKPIAAQISAVNTQLTKLLFFIDKEVDLNKRSKLITVGIKNQRITSVVTYLGLRG